MDQAYTNHLAGQSSPYLLQHVHNPVDWYPWGPEALQRARDLDRPILLSIGYAACHWCHVMERESFVDPVISQLMNAHYVCIKVDREERPDLDTIYMAATQAMNQGRGGWPMTVFLTPEHRPFFAGTYFAPHDHHGIPGFPRVLEHLAHLWRHDRTGLLKQAQALYEALQPAAPSAHAAQAPDSASCMQLAVAQLSEDFDIEYGGFGPAPKFPHTTGLRLLMAHSHWHKDATAQFLIAHTLTSMAQGGMYDLIGGGFSRYSVDRRWHVPHFEKMLYDNALLAEVYAEAYAAYRDPAFAQVTRETLDFVLQELRGEHNGFFAALDADSEGVEGKFYVWTPAQVAEALAGMPPDAISGICGYLTITQEGNWEHGHSIARAEQSIEQAASRLKIDVEQLATLWAEARPKLYAARAARIWPSLDYKVLTAWNGLMLSGLAAGARVLNAPKYLAAAQAAALFLYQTMRRQDGKLWRSYGGQTPTLDAYLEDYAFVAEGLINVYEAGGAVRWLEWAQNLGEMLLTDFCDGASGIFFDTAHDHETLLWRSREGHDGATPNAHATAAHVLARLSVHTRRQAFAAAAHRAVAAYADAMAQSPQAYAKLTLTAEILRRGPVEYAVLFAPEHAEAAGEQAPGQSVQAASLWSELQKRYEPAGVLAHGVVVGKSGHAGPDALPLLRHKSVVDSQTTVYVCRGQTCGAPITTLPQWQAQADGSSGF